MAKSKAKEAMQDIKKTQKLEKEKTVEEVTEEVKPESEYLEMARRVQAEFDNYRRRNEQIVAITKEIGVLTAIEEFLPVLDSMVLALEQIQDENSRKGFEMIKNQLEVALKNLKVEKIEALGVEFDPNLHNAIMVEEDKNQPEGVVLQEFQAGYKLGDKVIRHSVVKINK